MLIEQGRPVSLILDDPLVYADDARLDLMVEILSEAAKRMQVILLTCRDRAFRHVKANRLTFTPKGRWETLPGRWSSTKSRPLE